MVETRVTPGALEALDVTDRGRCYPVPKSHMGQTVSSCDTLVLAGHAVRYYEKVLAEFEEKFLSLLWDPKPSC